MNQMNGEAIYNAIRQVETLDDLRAVYRHNKLL